MEEVVLCKGSSAILKEAVLWWTKQFYGKGSSVMVEEAVL